MKPLVLFYDGPCILCNYWIRRLSIWDKNDQLRFTSLDSDYALDFFKKHPSPLLEKDAILSWDSENGYFSESEVLFYVLKRLGGFWTLLLLFRVFPLSWTNGLYRFIAQNRYRWFGKYDHCPLPEARFRHKFI